MRIADGICGGSVEISGNKFGGECGVRGARKKVNASEFLTLFAN